MDTISATTKVYIKDNIFDSSKHWSLVKRTKDHGKIFKSKIDNIIVVYYPNYNTLKITTSLTKFLYKNNSCTFNYNDLELFYKQIDLIIRYVLRGVKINSIKYWNISRLDLASNFSCYNKSDKECYLNYIKNLNYSRCNKKDFESSVHSHNKSITYNFYDKNQEESVRGVQLSDDDILRMEIQLKNPTLYREFKNNKTVDNVLKSKDKLMSIYKNRLDKIGITPMPMTTNNTLNRINSLIADGSIGSASGRNIKNSILNNLDDVKYTTLCRYKKVLKEHGLNIYTLKSEVSSYINFSEFKLFEDEINVSKYIFEYFYLLILIILFLFPCTNFNILLFLNIVKNILIFSIMYIDDS